MSRRWLALALGIAVLGAAPATPARARELWRSGEWSLDWSGSIREVMTTTNGTDAGAFSKAAAEAGPVCALASLFSECPAFDKVGDKDTFRSLTRLRQQIELRYGERWLAHLTYDNEWRFGNLGGFLQGSADEFDTFLGLEDEIHTLGFHSDSKHRSWRHLAYRAYLHYEGERVRATVGRQRIPWGVGRLWNPIDRFNSIPPLAIEGDQRIGVDSINLRYQFSGFDQIQVVYAPETRHEDAKYAVRLQGVVADTDMGVVAGIFQEARVFGADFAGNLGDAAWRVEAVYTNPESKFWKIGDEKAEEVDRFWQIVVSLDYNFDVGNGIYVLVEHLYNGNALGYGEGKAGPLLPFFESTPAPPGTPPDTGPFVQSAAAEAFGSSSVITNARHQTGLQISSDVTTAVTGGMLLIWDWNGDSLAIFPTLQFTGFNSVELSLGAQFFVGGHRSQYGQRDPLAFLQVEYFF